MPTFVLMTKLSPSTVGDPRGRRELGQVWMRKVEEACRGIRWIAHYALLGPYDFMDVYEAPDEATAFKVSLLSRAHGAVTAESWPAIRYEEYLPLAESLGKPASGG